MALLTTFCRQCAKVELSDQEQLLNGRIPCASCGANVRVVPSCSFAQEDRPLFDDLRQVVADRTVPPAEARAIATRIASILGSGRDHEFLEQLTPRLPGLVPIQVATGANSHARQRALRLLRAIFEAMAQADAEAS
jgi:hypothetical protein